MDKEEVQDLVAYLEGHLSCITDPEFASCDMYQEGKELLAFVVENGEAIFKAFFEGNTEPATKVEATNDGVTVEGTKFVFG